MTSANQVAQGLIGTTLGDCYRVEQLLGEGGMGAVYYATQLRLDKPVAVKVMARELAAAPEALARFRREALVTSNLGHPNIVQVFDFSTTEGGEPYLVMEFLEGEDLERRLRREQRLSPPAALHIVKQVGAALMATHGKGIVHRDLKPANIYLVAAAGAGDFVKVLDFGISKVRSATTQLTRTASIMGTPGYMSPEQAQGKADDIDERTDQWALACITWECLAGEPPFQGESPLSTLFQVVNQPPPPLVPKVPGLHPKVEDALLRALSKKKADRFASINDFVAALEQAVTGAASSPLPSVSRTVQLSEDAADARPAAKSVQPTTLTRTAGERGDEVELEDTRSRAWIWAVAGAVAILLVGAFLLFRPGPAAKPVTAAPVPETPIPVAAPPPAAKPVEEPAPPPPAHGTTEREPPKPDRAEAPEDKRSPRAVPAAAPVPKRARPVRRAPVPRMIEDL